MSAAQRRQRRRRKAAVAEATVYRATDPSYENIGGRMETVRRLHDTLAALARCGTRPPTLAEMRAGRRFEDTYEQAQLDQPPALDPAQPGGGRGRVPMGPGARLQVGCMGRLELDRALAALGGAFTPMGRVVCAVLGEGRVLRQVGEALDLGTGKGAERAAKWLLIGALGVLAAHWGLVEAGAQGARGRKKRLDRDP